MNFEKNQRVTFFVPNSKHEFYPMFGYVCSLKRNFFGMGGVKSVNVKTLGFDPEFKEVPAQFVFDTYDLLRDDESGVCTTIDRRTIFLYVKLENRVHLANLSTNEGMKVDEGFFKENFKVIS